MLALRPICEHCAAPLPPESREARICSFECTFCRSCVEGVLAGVCPNCGGGFERRPIRPQRDHRGGNRVARYPPTAERRHRPVDLAAHAAFAEALRDVPPHER